MTDSYIKNQFINVMASSENSAQIRLKLQSANGATNWLNIMPKDFKQIEKILINSYLEGKK